MKAFLKYHWPGVVGVLILLLATAPVWVFAADAGDSLDNKTPLENWYYLTGLLIPVVTGALIKRNWSQGAKSAVMFALAAIVGVVGAYLRHELDNFDYSLTSIMAITVLAYGSYNSIWKAIPLPQLVDSATGGHSFAMLNPYNREKVVDPANAAVVEQVKKPV
jgi:hypothetical protein